MWFKLMGTEGILKIHFLVPGCVAYVDMTLGDKDLKGTVQDSLDFRHRYSYLEKARLEVVDKNVRIFLENSLIYETKYSKVGGKDCRH
jgi:hypothetical protein